MSGSRPTNTPNPALNNSPPAYNTPPSNAEVATEVQQLRNLVNQLRTQVQSQGQQAPAIQQDGGRDPGEAVKPPQPEPFNGTSKDVVPFLTRLGTYFRWFPRRLASAEGRVMYAYSRMEGTAATWFEPIIRDYLEHDDNVSRDQDTVNIFSEWDNFKTALKDTFGMVNKER